MPSKKRNLPEVVFLRALASLSVCIFHLYCGNTHLFPDTNFLKPVFNWGFLGVDVFFVISGFIICYAMPNGYAAKDVVVFFKKRLIRIEPPYLISILLVLLLQYISIPFNHLPYSVTLKDILLHIAYLNNFTGNKYFNVVYWTLGIEFQFYILIGFFYMYISKSAFTLVITVSLCLMLSFIQVKGMQLIFGMLPIFACGLATCFFKYKKMLSATVYFSIISCLLLSIFYNNWATGFACLFTLIVLNFFTYHNRIIQFFSDISYAIYLTHTTIGGRVINLGLRFVHNDTERCGIFILALITSIGFAYLFYLFFEKPFVQYSRKIQYKYLSTSNR